jgi:N utilization substance protein B
VAARSKARKRALDLLFESEQRGLPTLELLTERQSLGEHPVPEYAADLVRGVASNRERIDELISWNLVDWTLERMPAVDRNVLRLGVYELLWADGVPDGVAISEAVALVEDLSTDASPSFVNGVLARIKADKPTTALDRDLSVDAQPSLDPDDAPDAQPDPDPDPENDAEPEPDLKAVDPPNPENDVEPEPDLKAVDAPNKAAAPEPHPEPAPRPQS